MAMGGLYYEEFMPGMRFEHVLRRTVTETDNLLFSALTHNPAALHLDEEAMKAYRESLAAFPDPKIVEHVEKLAVYMQSLKKQP